VGKKNCQTSVEKAYLAFDCTYVSWSLPLSKLWHPAEANGISRSPGFNVWHPTVKTEVRTPGDTAGMGLEVQIYIRSPIGKRWQESTTILLN